MALPPFHTPKHWSFLVGKKPHGLLGISPPFCGKNLEEASIGRCASGGSGPYLGNSFQGNIPLMGPQNPTPRMMILPFFYRVLIHPRWLFGISSINSYLSGLFKIAGWNIPMFLIGNTSSIRVHFPYVSLPEGNVKFVPFIAHPKHQRVRLDYTLSVSKPLSWKSNLQNFRFLRILLDSQPISSMCIMDIKELVCHESWYLPLKVSIFHGGCVFVWVNGTIPDPISFQIQVRLWPTVFESRRNFGENGREETWNNFGLDSDRNEKSMMTLMTRKRLYQYPSKPQVLGTLKKHGISRCFSKIESWAQPW